MNESIRSEMREILNRLEKAHPGMKYVGLGSVLDISRNIETVQQRKVNQCTECGLPTSGVVCSVCQMKTTVSNWQQISLSSKAAPEKSH
jgi:uncharacterized protein (TIGR00269 family)